MTEKARAVGINHVSIEVGNINEAVAFYGALMRIKPGLLSETEGSIELGDQFVAFTCSQGEQAHKPGHFGFVVDDKEKVREVLKQFNIEPLPGRFFGFLDPWGNHIEVVSYENIKFTKSPGVLNGMGLADLKKNDRAQRELEEQGYSEPLSSLNS
ncbi:extradiol dioxygenase [Photorhabdus luminescens]|uniref:Extradiol dioxygenase n=1 Tax=Photorhabdus akhurstii TaxID=171438 RepID=A0ABX8LRE8_9GAMM|nr:extradiol dioxygenase [Photorhabdus akhurstii]QXF32986.1 extradiol dioxygenase [Photorhabdus akhurstii]UJD74784.1 extradiol dioxygenase [Photorhabdus luminescens]